MMTRFEMRSSILLGLLSLGVSGCASQGTVDALETELGALRTANTELDARARALEAENSELSGRLDDAETALARSEIDMRSMGQTHDQLVTELRNELASGQIQIRKAVDGVSVGVSDELLFASGSARLSDAGRDVLGRVAGQIRNDSTLVFVEGHTDDVRVGEALRDRYPTNWELGGARAILYPQIFTRTGP